MAGYYDDPSQWRLHSLYGDVPIKFLDVDGEFSNEEGSVNFKALIPPNRIKDFLVQTFPPPIQIGNITVPQAAGLPGLPALSARKVSFKAFDNGKPVDPFMFDPEAPRGTYGELIEVTVVYGQNRIQQPNPSDPFTFLEIEGNVTGEFLHTTAPKGRWKKATRDPKDPPDDKTPGADNAPLNPRIPGNTEPVANPTVPINVLVPKTEWTVKWNQIPFQYFNDTLMYRLRWCLGRVNSAIMPVLFSAEPETILFLGFNYKQQYTWREGYINRPPINVEMKFEEKRVVWNGVAVGHNHFWRPGVGWEYLFIDGVSTPTYAARDMNALFLI